MKTTHSCLSVTVNMDAFVDNLIEDETERNSLLAKPTCFIIVGKPGVGKSTLAKRIATSWKCVLIDDTDLLNTHIKETKEGIQIQNILSEGKSIPDDLVLQLILARLNSPDVEHYGYVLSWLPFIPDECMKVPNVIELIKNLKPAPDFIINVKCLDNDLVQRLSDLKHQPVMGQLYNRDQWKQEEEVFSKQQGNQWVDHEEVQTEEAELPKDIIGQMLRTTENLPRDALIRINMYKDTLLGPLEDYMKKHNHLCMLDLDGTNTPEELHMSVMNLLECMAVKRVPVPVLLYNKEMDEYHPDSMDNTEDLLKMMSSSRTVAPGFCWRRSRWGQTCPVALKEGKNIPGDPVFSVGFQDKLYILSSQEAYRKFVTNPRHYLLPPMPRLPCKVSIIGPPQSGKSTMCRLLAQHYGAVVLDVEELLQPGLAKAEQERLDKIQEETTQTAIETVKMTIEQNDETSSAEVTEDDLEVNVLVHPARENAKQLSTPPFDLGAGVLKNCIKEIEEVDSCAEARTGWVLDNFPNNRSQIEVLKKADIMPDIIFCLRDSDEHQALKRIYEMNKENVNKDIKKRLQDEMAYKKRQLLKQEEKESEAQSTVMAVAEEADAKVTMQSDATSSTDSATINKEAEADVLSEYFELGYPDVPEMNQYKVQMQQFQQEWTQMKLVLPDNHCILEIGSKSSENLLQEMIQQMEKPFQYAARDLSAFDLKKEAKDAEAFRRAEEGHSDNSTEEEKDERRIQTATTLLGDTKHFCPVALKHQNILWPCTDLFPAKYREKTFYFSSMEAKYSFFQNPAQFTAQTEPLQPPALRVVFLGVRGSDMSAHGEWLTQKLGLFYIKFRELLQKLIIRKTNKQIPYSDEKMSIEENCEDVEALIKETMKGNQNEIEDTSDNTQEVTMTEEEMAIKAYLSGGDPLTPQVLDSVIAPFWKKEPFRSTGFILDGFPCDLHQTQYMLDRELFPDVAVVMEVDVADVQKHLLPAYLEKRHELHNKHKEQLKHLHDLRKNVLKEEISKRKAELSAEQEPHNGEIIIKIQLGDYANEEDKDSDDTEDQTEAMLQVMFPLEDDKEVEDAKAEDADIKKLEMEIKERFAKDETDLVDVMKLLNANRIPKIAISASHRFQMVQHRLLQVIQPLHINRESIFQTCQPISYSLAQKLLLSCYKLHSAFGCWDPIQLYENRDTVHLPLWPLNTTHPLLLNQFIYFFASKENINKFMLNPLKYLRQPKPTPALPIKIAVTGPPKSGKTTVAEMFAQKYGLVQLSIGSVMKMVMNKQGHNDLADRMRSYLTLGLVVPDELAIQCLEVALLNPVCSFRGYVLDGFPMTLNQAKLMDSQSIIPMIVAELELNMEEVHKRSLEDKMKFKMPYPTHDSSELLDTSNYCYKEEMELVRQYYHQEHQNWFAFNGLKNKWWLWTHILKEVSISMKCIQSYQERTQSGQAACINRLCITPKKLDSQLGEFGQYCPVCLALHHHLVDCSDIAALTHAAEYRTHYYKLCGENHLKKFLFTPDQFVSPHCPHALPQPHLLPRKLTAIQVKSKFPQQAEMKGFCPVTYMDGKQRYEALVRGSLEYAVEYRERIYMFRTKQKQDAFMRTPETFWDQKLPCKVPPLCEPVPLTSLPTLGYLEQGVAEPLIKAMTAVGTLRPKYPFLSIQRSSVIYVALHLKAFNAKSTEHVRQMYKKKLARFEEDCALIPYLSSVMRGPYLHPSERPADFEVKLNRFLALGAPGLKEFQ